MNEYIKTYKDGTKLYYKDKEKTMLHREDGPAVEYADGSKGWYQNGKLHRIDGPALEWFDGDRLWYQNDKLHRMDGPAITTRGESKEWWVDHVFIFDVDKSGNIIERMK